MDPKIETVEVRLQELIDNTSAFLSEIAVELVAQRRHSGETHAEAVDAVRDAIIEACNQIRDVVDESLLWIEDDDD